MTKKAKKVKPSSGFSRLLADINRLDVLTKRFRGDVQKTLYEWREQPEPAVQVISEDMAETLLHAMSELLTRHEEAGISTYDLSQMTRVEFAEALADILRDAKTWEPDYRG